MTFAAEVFASSAKRHSSSKNTFLIIAKIHMSYKVIANKDLSLFMDGGIRTANNILNMGARAPNLLLSDLVLPGSRTHAIFGVPVDTE